MEKKKLIKILIATASLIAIIVICIFGYRQYIGYGYLNITIAPENIEYKIGSRKYTGDQEKIKLATGSYSITFEDELYENRVESFEIEKNQTKSITVVMNLKDSYDADYYSLDSGTQTEIDAYDDKVANIAEQKFASDNPLTTILPHITEAYRIDYGFDTSEQIYYEITVYTVNTTYDKEALTDNAKAWLESQGFSPDDYTFKITEE